MAPRAATYERKSYDTGISRSIAQQNADGRKACQHNGWDISFSRTDPISASRYERKRRPGWEAIVAEVTAGRVDVVVLWEPSRGDRKMDTWVPFLSLCREHHVLIHVTSHGKTYDPANARDRRGLIEDGTDSEYESEKISARTRRGLADGAVNGDPFGRIPYGYLRRYDTETRRPVQEANPDTADTARGIITRIADGDSILGIRNDLHARGIASPSGQEWWPRRSITWMVTDGVVYIGKRRHNGGPLLDGNWPALVSEEVYWRAVRVMESRRSAEVVTRPGKARHLLSYLISCHCGADMSVQKRSGRSVYRCAANRAGCMWAEMENLDNRVSDAVVRYLAEPGTYEKFSEADHDGAQAARDEAAAERARLADFEAQAIEGKLSPAVFARIAEGIEKRIAELDHRSSQLSVPPALAGVLTWAQRHPVAARRGEVRVRWEEMSIAARRTLITEVCAPVVYLDRVEMNFKDVVS